MSADTGSVALLQEGAAEQHISDGIAQNSPVSMKHYPTVPAVVSGPKHRSYYRPELDALRFFAFACVFCSHVLNPPSWYLPIFHMGSLGLGIFFLLSAFLITTLLLNEKAEFGTIHVKAFFVRRILRIWPLYLFMIALAIVLGIFEPTRQVHKLGLMLMLLMAGNVFVLKRGWMLGVLNPLWSISVEEQFYIMCPFLGRLLSKKTLVAFYTCVITLSYLVLFWLGKRHELYILGIWANSFVQFQFFAAGGLLAILRQREKFQYGGPLRLLMLVIGVACWYVSAMRYHIHDFAASTWSDSLSAYASALLGAVFIFLSFLDAQVKVPAWLIYLGKISFGLYVFHQLFIDIVMDPYFLLGPMMPGLFFRHRSVALLTAMAGTIAAAALSYKYLESPFLRLKRRFEFLRTRPV